MSDKTVVLEIDKPHFTVRLYENMLRIDLKESVKNEIEEAILVARKAGAKQIALLKCTSSYPAPPEEMNLRAIPHLAEAFGVPVGLSDHTLGIAVPVVAVSMGACIVEKHFTLSRKASGPDSSFSLEPQEFAAMVQEIRISLSGRQEGAVATTHYKGPIENDRKGRKFKRSVDLGVKL